MSHPPRGPLSFKYCSHFHRSCHSKPFSLFYSSSKSLSLIIQIEPGRSERKTFSPAKHLPQRPDKPDKHEKPFFLFLRKELHTQSEENRSQRKERSGVCSCCRAKSFYRIVGIFHMLSRVFPRWENDGCGCV